MAYYSNDIINEVFAENDIVDYISQYVALKKTGRDYNGLCPFHKEKSPSFHVNREKQLFHCFGCGASGNLVQFVMRTEGLDFVEALKLLADRAGIVLPEENSGKDYALHEKRKRIYEINKCAARFFYNELIGESGKNALNYLKNRKLSPQTIKAYGLGYAPESFDSLMNHLSNLGFSTEDIHDADLIIKSEKNGRYFDKFRDRIMFPIFDLRGNVIAFGGRVLHNLKEINGYKVSKYVNSTETPVYVKGKNVFSLNIAKKNTTGTIILAEGYMDVISVYQAGITNVVAGLGTALTKEQAQLILKYCSEILICYDSDEAGQNAAERAIDIINDSGGRSKVIRLKGAKDPDEYIKANGVEMFKKAVSDAIPSTEYRLNLLKAKYNLDVSDGKIAYVNDAAKILGKVHDAVEVDVYVRMISEELDIAKDAIYAEYKKHKRTTFNKNKNSLIKKDFILNKETPNLTFAVNHTSSALELAEKKLLNMIVQNKRFCSKSIENFSYEEFSNDIYKKLAEKIYENYKNNVISEPAILLNEFEAGDIKTVSEVFYNLETYDNDEKTFNELINSIKREKLKIRIATEKDPMVLKELLKQQIELSKIQ